MYEPDEVQDVVEVDDVQEDVALGDDTTEGIPEGQPVSMTQQDIQTLIDRRLARERAKRDREDKKIFGTTDRSQIANYYQAGRVVSEAAGAPPDEVVRRVKNEATTGGDVQMADELTQRLSRIEEILSQERESQTRAVQVQEAKAEFGTLYDDYEEDILDKAEELQLSLQDAATIVLRPHLREYYANRSQQSKAIKQQRKVDPTGDAPVKGVQDYDTLLSAAEKRIAQRMRLSYKDYYDNKTIR